jgi:hypothetical protein
MRSLSTWGAFGMGVLVCSIDTTIGNTEETLLSPYEETEARLKTIEDAGYKVVSIWGCQFRKLLRENRGLVNELCSHPYIKNYQINM